MPSLRSRAKIGVQHRRASTFCSGATAQASSRRGPTGNARRRNPGRRCVQPRRRSMEDDRIVHRCLQETCAINASGRQVRWPSSRPRDDSGARWPVADSSPVPSGNATVAPSRSEMSARPIAVDVVDQHRLDSEIAGRPSHAFRRIVLHRGALAAPAQAKEPTGADVRLACREAAQTARLRSRG